MLICQEGREREIIKQPGASYLYQICTLCHVKTQSGHLMVALPTKTKHLNLDNWKERQLYVFISVFSCWDRRCSTVKQNTVF